MKHLNGTIQGNWQATEDTEFHGIVTGNAKVLRGVSVAFHGLVSGDLWVEQAARVEVHGTVVGAVVNEGGQVTVWGTVGRIRGDNVSIMDGASVRER